MTAPRTPSTAPAHSPRPRERRQRSMLEVRWRQWRNAPPPITRAVAADLIVASLLAVPLLAYEMGRRGSPTDLGAAAVAAYVGAVLLAGSVLTYLWVPLPTGASRIRRRTLWSAALGIFAAVPIAYLVLVITFQIIEPLLTR